MTFKIYFLIRLIIEGNLTHLAQKNLQARSKINTIYHKTVTKTV